jgi:hypothetical protein
MEPVLSIRDLVLFVLGGSFGQEIEPERKFQKVVWLFSKQLGIDTSPINDNEVIYSQKVAEAFSELKAMGYFQEVPVLTKDGQALLERKKKEYESAWNSMEQTAEIVTAFSEINEK